MTAPRTNEFNPLEYLRSIGPCPCKCEQRLGTFACRPVQQQETPTQRPSLGEASWESVTSDDDIMGNGGIFLNRAPALDDNHIDLGRQKINTASPSRQPSRIVRLSISKGSLKSFQEHTLSAQEDDNLLSLLECSRQTLLAAMAQSAESRRMCRKRQFSSLETPDEDANVMNHRKRLYEATKYRMFDL